MTSACPPLLSYSLIGFSVGYLCESFGCDPNDPTISIVRFLCLRIREKYMGGDDGHDWEYCVVIEMFVFSYVLNIKKIMRMMMRM